VLTLSFVDPDPCGLPTRPLCAERQRTSTRCPVIIYEYNALVQLLGIWITSRSGFGKPGCAVGSIGKIS
jgi:hypothetical protein